MCLVPILLYSPMASVLSLTCECNAKGSLSVVVIIN